MTHQNISPEAEAKRRWQLILGADARSADGSPMAMGNWSPQDSEIQEVLGFLYDREHAHRRDFLRDREGTEGESELSVPTWLARIRDLFPQTTAELLTHTALERYGMAEVLADPKVLDTVTPNMELLRALLAVKGIVPKHVLSSVRRIIRKVVEELRAKLEITVRRHLAGSVHRHSRSPIRLAKNFDIIQTIRKNLKNYQPAEKRLLVERALFYSRQYRRQPWDLLLVVDQSGSMTESVIHAAVMAGIFLSIPSLRTRLVVFDTEVIDVTEDARDTVELLLQVQLGGGTDIAKALDYAQSQITRPRQTMLVLVTDFFEGGDESRLNEIVGKLANDGVILLGLAALDSRAKPAYNRDLAKRLSQLGMTIGAMTPDRLAEWVAERVHQ